MTPILHKGQIVRWQDDRGFGFIQPTDGGQEVFLHISGLKNAARRPQVGDTIFYQSIAGEDGRIRACNARIVGAIAESLRSSPSGRSPSQPQPQTSALRIEILLLSAIPILGSIHFALMAGNPIPLLLYLGMGLLTFSLYARDKACAEQGKRRISERTLHLCELLGGWIGAFIAQRIIRHKSSKASYQIVFWTIVTIHLTVWLDWLFLGGTLIQSILLHS